MDGEGECKAQGELLLDVLFLHKVRDTASNEIKELLLRGPFQTIINLYLLVLLRDFTLIKFCEGINCKNTVMRTSCYFVSLTYEEHSEVAATQIQSQEVSLLCAIWQTVDVSDEHLHHDIVSFSQQALLKFLCQP